jgi:hypothetical protein
MGKSDTNVVIPVCCNITQNQALSIMRIIYELDKWSTKSDDGLRYWFLGMIYHYGLRGNISDNAQLEKDISNWLIRPNIIHSCLFYYRAISAKIPIPTKYNALFVGEANEMTNVHFHKCQDELLRSYIQKLNHPLSSISLSSEESRIMAFDVGKKLRLPPFVPYPPLPNTTHSKNN